MKEIKVKFLNGYRGDYKKLWVYQILKRHYDVKVCEEPDFLVDYGLGAEHYDYDCVKLKVIGENFVPDFNEYDYAIGFDPIVFEDRYLQMPLFPRYNEFKTLETMQHQSPEKLLNREFCSFVVSRGEKDPMRVEFFKRLSKYKPVASGGRFMNNVGGPVADKLAFCAEHKFNIAFENSTIPGYTTEKIMQALAVESVPIYYGDPQIDRYFDPACMVRVSSKDDIERAVEEIIQLDKDDEAYLQKVMAPSSMHDFAWYEERMTTFLRHIFDQDPKAARRTCPFGHQYKIRRHLRRMENLYLWTSPAKVFKRFRRKVGLA